MKYRNEKAITNGGYPIFMNVDSSVGAILLLDISAYPNNNRAIKETII
jgi:hypothetical protein